MQDAPCASGSGATKEGDAWISLDEKRRRDQVAAEESRKAEAAAAKLKSERLALFAHTPTTSDLLRKIAEPLGHAIGCGKNVEQAMARVKPWVERLLPPQTYVPKNSAGSARDQYSTDFVRQIDYYEDQQRKGKTKNACKDALKAFDMLNADDVAPPKPKDPPRIQVVSDTSLSPKKGRRIEIHVSDVNFSKIECNDVIAKYRIVTAPNGQISVHKPSARFKNLMTPWCVENFDGKAPVFNDHLF